MTTPPWCRERVVVDYECKMSNFTKECKLSHCNGNYFSHAPPPKSFIYITDDKTRDIFTTSNYIQIQSQTDLLRTSHIRKNIEIYLHIYMHNTDLSLLSGSRKGWLILYHFNIINCIMKVNLQYRVIGPLMIEENIQLNGKMRLVYRLKFV